MTAEEDRWHILTQAKEACRQGASWEAIADAINLSARTLSRWLQQGENCHDRRPGADRPTSANALSEEEKKRILEVVNQPEFASMPPEAIVATLANRGEYIASASTFYRVMREAKQVRHRGKARAPKPKKKTLERTADAANQIWVIDVTYLLTDVNGRFLKLYMLMDLFSRDIMGWEVFEEENSTNSQTVIQRAMIAQGVRPDVIHADNGSPFKNANLHTMLLDRGIQPSHSRARVSNDNAHAEALFRTVKHHPSLPEKPFSSLADARQWVKGFVQWYRHEHLHKGIGMVTPAQKHSGEDIAILAKRKETLEAARAKRPNRWIKGKTQTCKPTGSVSLRAVKPSVKSMEKAIKKIA